MCEPTEGDPPAPKEWSETKKDEKKNRSEEQNRRKQFVYTLRV